MTRREKVSPNVSGNAERVIAPERALVPATVQLNEQRVSTGFWPKIGRVAARVPFAREALAVWHCARDPETPARSKGIMLAALAYFVMPVDAIPDLIAGLGFTDDAAVFAALMAVIGRNLKPRHREAAQRDLDRLLNP
jgi:uncharacterized membrane protein YkvA (DUF1232 family)